MPIKDQLISYWDMDEASGNAVDQHGSNDLTDTNTVGADGGMRDFEADNAEYFTINDNAGLSTGTGVSWTFAAWVRPETVTGFPMIGMKGWGDAGEREWVLYLSGPLPTFEWDNGSITGALSSSFGNLSTATLYFVVCGYDSASGAYFMSVNANAADEDDAEAVGGSRNGAGPFVIGASPLQTVYWDGRIGPSGFWKRALTGAEITELYNSGTPLKYGDLADDVPVVASAAVDSNGHDVRFTFTATGTMTGNSGLTIKVGGVSHTIASYLWTSATTLRVRLANGEGQTIEDGETVTYDYSAAGGNIADDAGELEDVTGGSITNNSDQTDDGIYYRGIQWNFTTPTGNWRGIYATGDWMTTQNPTSRTPAASGSDSTFRNGCMIDPVSAALGPQGFDGRHGATFDGGYSASYPVSLSTGQALVSALSLAELGTWQAEHAYSVGDAVADGPFERTFVVVTAGTSGAEEPAWATADRTEFADGTVTWRDYGNARLETAGVLTKVAAIGAVTDFRPPFSGGGATKTAYDTSDLNSLGIDYASPASTPTIAATMALVERPWIEVVTDGIGGQASRAHRNMAGYGQLVSRDAGIAVGQLLIDASYADELRVHIAQRAIDYRGMMESGGEWIGESQGGQPNGRFLFAAVGRRLFNEAAFVTAINNTLVGELGTSGQTFYINGDVISLGTDYVAGDLYKPEWGNGLGAPASNNSSWTTIYRQCCTAIDWWVSALTIEALDLIDEIDGGRAFVDYQRRYKYQETEEGGEWLYGNQFTYDLYDDNIATASGAFGIDDATLSENNTVLTITFNRYATGTVFDRFALSGAGVLSNGDFTGPRTLVFAVAGYVDDTLEYDDTDDDIVDAGNTSLVSFSGLELTEESSGGGIGGITSSPAGWLRRRRLKF
jgi:hypothetical protein